jgi:hypothetical protein
MRRSVCAASIVLAAGAVASAQPANNDCSGAEAISGLSTFAFDTTLATTDGLDNALCNFFGQSGIGNDVWYCWTAAASGPVRLTTCNLTGVDTKIAIYDGCTCPEGSAILACGDDACALQTSVSWLAQAGHSYLVRIGNYPGATGGPGSFTVESAILLGPVVNPANGHSYYMLSPSTWEQGEAAALSLGGHLATVDDAAENEFLRASVLGFDLQDRRGWIGLNDVGNEGTFTWISGAPVGYTNWNGGEPNNTGGAGEAENYVEMFGSNGEWNDTINQPAFSTFPLIEVAGGAPTCYANCDNSSAVPFLNVNDFICFQSKFAAGDSYANCDNSTTAPVLNINDFICFQSKFAAGCSAP